MRLRYYRLLNTPPTLWRLLTVQDILFVGIPTVLLLGFGLKLLAVVLVAGWAAHMYFFRRGKPRGYTKHWLSDRFRPRRYRPGRDSAPLPHPNF